MPVTINGVGTINGVTLPTTSFGKVIQVVSATYSTLTTNNTNVAADSGLTATITPSSVNNKILVCVSQNGCYKEIGNAGSGLILTLLRGATLIATLVGSGGYTNTNVRNDFGSVSGIYLDAPATTSSTTYKTQLRNLVNATGVAVQVNSETSSMILLEVAA